MVSRTVTERVRELVKERGLVRPRDLEEAGHPTYLLYRLRDRGEVEEVAPGLFASPNADFTERHSYAVAAKLVPRGIVCLLSALAFHEVGTQMPQKVWMALERGNRRRPVHSRVPVDFVWFSGASFQEGQEVHEVQGVEVRVYSLAKTVADLFKYRRKLGIDVGIEALQEGWRERLFTVDDLDKFARISRVRRVMHPYLEFLVATS